MKNLLWLLIGVVGGFVAAHFLNKDPRANEVLRDIDERISEIGHTISEAYYEREATLADADTKD